MIQTQIQENPEFLTQFVKELTQKRNELARSQTKIENFFNTLEELRKEFSPAEDSSVEAEHVLLTLDVTKSLSLPAHSVNAWGQSIPANVQRYKLLEVTGRKANGVYLKPLWFTTDTMYSARALRTKYIEQGLLTNIWIAEGTITEGAIHTYRRRMAMKLMSYGWKSAEEVAEYIKSVKFKDIYQAA